VKARRVQGEVELLEERMRRRKTVPAAARASAARVMDWPPAP
jgi:hypothetical protein